MIACKEMVNMISENFCRITIILIINMKVKFIFTQILIAVETKNSP